MSSIAGSIHISARGGARAARSTHRWWPLAVIAAAHLMAILDITVMFVALPSAQRALHMAVSARQWVLSAYTLAFAALLLLGGRLADRCGARRTLVTGVIGFAVCSAVGGAANDGAMLIAARAAQGAFGAVLVSSTKSLLATVYSDEHERARAMGIFGATLTAGMALGLILGGALTSGLGWRWCLYVNLAVCLLVVPGALRVLPSIPSRPVVRLDPIGALLCSAGMVALVYGLGEVTALGWGSERVVGCSIGAVLALAAFLVRQARYRDGLLPLRVVRDRNRGGALIAMVFNGLSTVGMMLILTYELQSVLRYSPLHTGLLLIPFALAAAFGATAIARRLMTRVAPRWLIAVGLTLSAAGLVPLLGLTATGHCLPSILIAESIEGLGTGLAGPPILSTALRAVAPGDIGAASALSSAAGQLGSSVGVALLNTIAATATVAYLGAHAAASGTAADIAAANVHGYTVAVAWGAAILFAIVVPVVALIDAGVPRRGAPGGALRAAQQGGASR
jgi:EmrB/QacA subfamily drug resistance transporter